MTDAGSLPPDQFRQVLDSSGRFAYAGKIKDARALLAPLWPAVCDGIQGLGEFHDVNIFAAIALGYRRLGLNEPAKNFANTALIVDPADTLGHVMASVSDRMNIARLFMQHQQISKALTMFEALHTLAPSSETAFYLSMLNHVEAEKARVRGLSPLASSGTLFNLVVWGEAYVGKFMRWALPSLLAPGNIPALAAEGPVIFDIYTGEQDRLRFEAAPLIQSLKQYAWVDFTIIPENILRFERAPHTYAPDRLFTAAAQYVSAAKAKALGADFTHVVTEGLYSDQFYARAKAYLQSGYKAVLGGSLRAQESGVAAALKNRGFPVGESVAVDAETLVDLTVRNLNPHVRDLFISTPEKTVGQDPISIYFKTAEGFSARSFQLSPVLVRHDVIPEDLECDYFTADCRLLAEVAQGCDFDQIFKIISDPARDLFVADMDSGTDGTERTFGDFPVTVRRCAESTIFWCVRESDYQYFDWAYDQKIEFECDPTTLPSGGLDEAECVAEFHRLFAEMQDENTERIRFFRGHIKG